MSYRVCLPCRGSGREFPGPNEPMRFFRGDTTKNDAPTEVREGTCLTESERVASHYAPEALGGRLWEIEVDMDGLTVVDVPGYDHDENLTPADDDEFRARYAAEGADVLRYRDEDDRGETFDCYRLVSARALAAVRSVIEIDR